MKLSKPPNDGKLHTYCLRCRRETVRRSSEQGREVYYCSGCNYVSPRALIVDPQVKWWLGQGGEYWHETAGVFVRNARNEFLFLERARFPVGLTIPAGHVDYGETPIEAAYRELFEEAGFHLPKQSFQLVAFENILGDECRRGSDAHRWTAYVARVRSNATVKIDPGEVLSWQWLTLGQALQRTLVPAVRSLITRHAQHLLGDSG